MLLITSVGVGSGISLNHPVDSELSLLGDGLQVKVFPNPFSDRVVISSNERIDSYRIYNILGALVGEGKSQSNQLELDTSRLGAGIYMMEVQSGNRRVAVKIVRK